MGFIQPPWPSLSSKGHIQTVANEEGEIQKQGRSSQETTVQPWGRVLVSPQGIHITISLSSSVGTKAPPRWRMATSGWAQIPGALLTHHQPIRRKSHTLQPSPPILPIKTFPPKPSGSLGFWGTSHPFSLLGPAITLSMLQTPIFRFVWPHCALGTWTCANKRAKSVHNYLTFCIFKNLLLSL